MKVWRSLILIRIMGPPRPAVCVSTGIGSPGSQAMVFDINLHLRTSNWRFQKLNLEPSASSRCPLTFSQHMSHSPRIAWKYFLPFNMQINTYLCFDRCLACIVCLSRWLKPLIQTYVSFPTWRLKYEHRYKFKYAISCIAKGEKCFQLEWNNSKWSTTHPWQTNQDNQGNSSNPGCR